MQGLVDIDPYNLDFARFVVWLYEMFYKENIFFFQKYYIFMIERIIFLLTYKRAFRIYVSFHYL